MLFKLLRFYGFIFLALLGFTCAVSSCSSTSQLSKSVRRVLADPVKFAQVRDSVFTRGLCLNDTVVTEVTRDTTIYVTVPVPGTTTLVRTPAVCKFDTTVSGTRVVLKDGTLHVYPAPALVKTNLRTEVKINTVRDKAKEQVLEKQVVLQKEQLMGAGERIATLEKVVQQQPQTNAKLQLKIYGLGLLTLVLGLLLLKKTLF